ncbi:unnamed protein product, partial [marine sediment metagenome]
MVIHKIYNFIGGLFQRDTDKELVADNQVINIKNFIPKYDGILEKRPGRDYILKKNAGYRITG